MQFFNEKCQKSATSGSKILETNKVDDILCHHSKQEKTTRTKRVWQTLKALGQQKKILRPETNRRLGPVHNGQIVMAGKHLNTFEKWTLCRRLVAEK